MTKCENHEEEDWTNHIRLEGETAEQKASRLEIEKAVKKTIEARKVWEGREREARKERGIKRRVKNMTKMMFLLGHLL